MGEVIYEYKFAADESRLKPAIFQCSLFQTTQGFGKSQNKAKERVSEVQERIRSYICMCHACQHCLYAIKGY